MQYAHSLMLPDWLTRTAENQPEKLAIQSGAWRWTFAELADQAHHLAGQLATLGITDGSRVALLAGNSLAYVALVHALTRLGAIFIPLNTRLTRQELNWQIADARAVLLVSDPTMQERASELLVERPELPLALLQTVPTGPASCQIHLHAPDNSPYKETNFAARTLLDLQATQAIMYTSGTTGYPKGVLITYGMQWWNALGSALNLGHGADDCWLACLPLFHIGGLSLLMKNVIYGIRIVLHEKFDEQAINRDMQTEGVTIISVVAVMLQRMLTALGSEARYSDTLRCVLLGGGPAPLPLLEACARLHIPVVQTYGLTEACSQAVTLAPGDALRKIGSAGRPLLPVQLQIRDEARVLPANQAGVIYLQGPTITPGYADRPEITAAAFHNGWFCTGDLGYLDEEGYLYVLDRRSDLIISGGENIYPAEIESALLTYPDVAEAGVCGQSDPQWGQVPIAFVRLHPDRQCTPEAILQTVARHLARYKMPRALYIVAELPRNSSGKLLRRELPGLLTRLPGPP
jgi:O-succinylbenzoic acid--CoA ligase